NPSAVAGPARGDVFVCVIGKTAGLSAFGADHIDVRVFLNPGVENDLLAVRRPAGSTGERTAYIRQLPEIRSVAVAQPDFKTAGPAGSKYELLAVRGALGGVVRFPCRESL